MSAAGSSKKQTPDTARGCSGYERNLEQNWNGNVVFSPTHTFVPESTEELCQIVADATGPLRVVGRGHSFSPLAECRGGTLLSLVKLSKVLEFKPPTSGKSAGFITFQGGATYTDVIQFLGTRGALRNLPSCPQFTVAGAIATGTHGSGIKHLNLAADVKMMEFVTADGTLKKYDDSEVLEGCRIHLGALGVVSSLTLEVMPYFEVESFRYDDVPLTVMIDNLSQMWEACDSLSVWTSGFGSMSHGSGTCWLAFRHFVAPNESLDKERAQERHMELLQQQGVLLERQIPRYCTDPLNPSLFHHTGRKSWHDGLTLTMEDGSESSMTTIDLQAEFFVPLECHRDALHAVWEVAKSWTFSSPWGYDKGTPERGLVDAMEFRQVKGGDGGWLSPHPIDSLGIHVSFNGDPKHYSTIVQDKVPALERALQPFGVRAHWGKLLAHGLVDKDTVAKSYPGLPKFRELCSQHDPDGKFRNSFVSQTLFGAEGPE